MNIPETHPKYKALDLERQRLHTEIQLTARHVGDLRDQLRAERREAGGATARSIEIAEQHRNALRELDALVLKKRNLGFRQRRLKKEIEDECEFSFQQFFIIVATERLDKELVDSLKREAGDRFVKAFQLAKEEGESVASA